MALTLGNGSSSLKQIPLSNTQNKCKLLSLSDQAASSSLQTEYVIPNFDSRTRVSDLDGGRDKLFVHIPYNDLRAAQASLPEFSGTKAGDRK